MKQLVLVFILITLIVSSCKVQQTERFIVASAQGDCVGVVPQKCLMIKSEGKSDWNYFYSAIEGFIYEPGYEYELDVKKEEIKDTPADRSAFRYVLVKQVSKVEKESENLPQ
mgnify:CR=1 FL=1